MIEFHQYKKQSYSCRTSWYSSSYCGLCRMHNDGVIEMGSLLLRTYFIYVVCYSSISNSSNTLFIRYSPVRSNPSDRVPIHLSFSHLCYDLLLSFDRPAYHPIRQQQSWLHHRRCLYHRLPIQADVRPRSAAATKVLGLDPYSASTRLV